MSHDIQAAWASTEVAHHIKTVPGEFFAQPPTSGSLSVYASREGRNVWPIADGVINIEQGNINSYSIALEFKQQAEGVHGILTALGQANAYLHKGFSASVIVLPKTYISHKMPCEHLRDVIDLTEPNIPIAIFSYQEPDPSSTSPFENKLTCIRKMNLNNPLTSASSITIQPHSQTQWAHLREGSSDPAAFYNYLKTAKQLVCDEHGNIQEPLVNIPDNIRDALTSFTSVDPLMYLSNSTGEDLHSKVWRNFWFKYILTEEVIPLWKGVHDGVYTANDSPSKILLSNGRYKLFFYGRSDSIKNILIDKLNGGLIDEKAALTEYVTNIHNRAHSYREDIDSGLADIGLLDVDGRPSELGYKYVDSCDRNKDCNTGTPITLLGSAILNNGQLGAFIHYLYKLSENKFSADPTAFSLSTNSSITFNQDAYLHWLEDQLTNNMGVMRKVSQRGGAARKPFQAELSVLRFYNFVKGFRIGVGLEINWPEVQEAMDFEL